MSSSPDEQLRVALAQHMDTTDQTTLDIVTAVAGLLASVAYADRTITEEESVHLKTQLARLQGVAKSGVEAISAVLEKHALRFSTAYVPRFTRVLREELPEEHRAEMLDALLAMAAADGAITTDETITLRNMTSALGLSQTRYNELQRKYEDKLQVR